MSSTLAIDSNNAIGIIIDQAYPKNRLISNTEFNSSSKGAERISQTSAVSTTLSRDYTGSSIIDRGTVFSIATGGLASMNATSTTPPYDAYNESAFLITQAHKPNRIGMLRVF